MNFDQRNIHKFLLVAAAYGVVQILAQDLGIKTGKKQRDLIQTEPISALMLFAGAYTVTEDLQLAGVVTGIYYLLKFFYSKGVTSAVCFEDV